MKLISTTAFSMGDRFFEYTKQTQEATFVAETGYHTFLMVRGDMTTKQYKQKIATAQQ